MLTTSQLKSGSRGRKKAGRRKQKERQETSRRLCRGVESLEQRAMLSVAPFFSGVGDLPGGRNFKRSLRRVGRRHGRCGAKQQCRRLDEAFKWTLAEGIQPLGIVGWRDNQLWKLRLLRWIGHHRL